VRGASGEEKILKNAKDTCASESLEIATYTVLEHLANAVGDTTTAKLAASIRADEERMLDRILRELPKLARAVVRSEVDGDPSYDITQTAAADAVRETAAASKRATRNAKATAKRTARQAREVPGVARVEGQVKGAVASEDDLAIAGYDKLTVEEIVGKLAELSQIDLAKVNAYERKTDNRSTVLSRISTLEGSEPWPGYDELTVEEIRAAVGDDDERANSVRRYERAHKNRAGVLNAVEREPATA
jgi:rubrerythrin